VNHKNHEIFIKHKVAPTQPLFINIFWVFDSQIFSTESHNMNDNDDDDDDDDDCMITQFFSMDILVLLTESCNSYFAA